MMKLAQKNIERVKVYYYYGTIFRIVVYMKDKTVREKYTTTPDGLGKTVEKYMNRSERIITPCGAGYSTTEYKL